MDSGVKIIDVLKAKKVWLPGKFGGIFGGMKIRFEF